MNKTKSHLKEVKNQNYEANKMNSPQKPKKKKNLPWWVEFLFVQIGLPDSLLIKILKVKRKSKDLIKSEKNSLITFFLILTAFVYFYPVIKHSKNKLDCEVVAKNYIIKSKNISSISKRELKMLSTNFCNGGDEIYKYKN